MLKMQKFTDKKEETAPEPAVSQKEYLQRYLMKNKGKKVKKKKPKISSSSHLKRSVIIDDDVDLNLAGNVDEEAFNLDYMGDEAPQICGYTDDRPLELQLKEKFSSGNWKSIGEIEAEEQEARRVEDEKVAAARKRLESGDRGQRDLSPTTTGRKQKKTRGRTEGDDSDMSPPRKVRTRGSDSDLSPPRKPNEKSGKRTNSRNKESDSDLSPPRGRNDRKVRRRGSDSDLSPPRKSTDKMRRRTDDRPKRGSDSDLSPPRKGRRGHSDRSPPRKKSLKSKGSDSDLSPPRKSSRPAVTKDSKRRPRHDSDSDLSPPRRQNDNRSGGKREKSPQRRNAVESDRRERQTRSRNDSDSDLSPPRKGQKHIKKLDKTLDGKTAGLQDAKRLKEELKAIKDKEDRMFKKLDANLLGKSAAPVLRDRKTGQKRDLEKEKQAAREKAEREDMRKNKYDRWGRGLKQVHEREEQMADMLHEMSKPLARYKDDADLDRLLKNRQREGDPMLDYIRNKQQESHVVDLTVDGVRAKYMGTFMPNRFNIPPGHRWDGVDRSNGYEQKWFEAKSAKVAVEEEAWKWSCADM